MTIEVTQTRRDGRRERSRVTRARVVEAAYALFCDRGLTVTMNEIATSAGVSVQTVYGTYRSKQALLAEVLRYAVHGDDSPAPPHERPWFAHMVEEPDPRVAIEILLEGTRGIYERVSPLAGVFRTTETEVAALWARSEELRYAGMRQMTRELATKGRLKDGVDLRTASDIVFVLLGPESYQSFAELGWSVERWQVWVAATLETALFDG